MAILDYITIFVFTAGILVVGMSFAKTGSSMKSFFAAGGDVPWWISGLSLFMGFFSAGTFVVWGSIAYSYGNGGIAFDLDGNKLTSELLVPSTRSDKEPVAWRQWHHWNRIDELTTVKLKKGIHVLTLKTVSNGNMNYDYLNFKLKK